MQRPLSLAKRAFVLPLRRRFTRAAAVAGASVLVSLGLVVTAPHAIALAPPVIPPIIPVELTGTVTTVGTTGAVIEPVAPALTGLGAYAGTCWVLGKLIPGSAGCPGFTVLGFHFPSIGGSRPTDVPTFQSGEVVRGGNNATLNGPDGHYSTNWFFHLDQANLGPTGRVNGSYRYGFECMDGFKQYKDTFMHVNTSFGPTDTVIQNQVLDQEVQGNSGVCGAASAGYSVLNSITYPAKLKNVFVDYALCGGSICSNTSTTSQVTSYVRAQTLTFGGGTPTAWTVTYSETCTNGTQSVVRSETKTFQPTPNGDSPPSTLPACWDVLPNGYARDYTVKGGRSTVSNPEVTVHYPTFGDGVEAKYPLCIAALGTPDGCSLDLLRNNKSCLDGVNCAGWPQHVRDWDMSCQWGPYEVAISMCEREYKTSFDVQTEPRPSDPSATPNVPTEACQVRCVTPPISPEPPNPKDGGDNCISDIFSLNPIDWVYVPVKCVLKWAFVPDSAAFSDVINNVKDAWLDSTPGRWVQAIGNLVPSGGLSGCQGPPLNLDFKGVHVHERPFSACSGVGATAASFVNLVLSVGTVIAGGFACVRAVGSGFGWRPGSGGADA